MFNSRGKLPNFSVYEKDKGVKLPMTITEKTEPIRDKKLMAASKDRSCVSCGADNGTVVRCHYSGMRQHQYGKGRGIKGHDLIAADLCNKCHAKYDQYKVGSGDTQYQKDIDHSERFLHCVVLTLSWGS